MITYALLKTSIIIINEAPAFLWLACVLLKYVMLDVIQTFFTHTWLVLNVIQKVGSSKELELYTARRGSRNFAVALV